MIGHVVAMDALLEEVTQSIAELVVPRHSRLLPTVARVLEPGKLFRPRLTLGVAAALGSCDPDAAVRAATAVELLHMSSLIHDDLMDDSPQRRGVRSIHVAASPAIAVAMGDLLLARGAGVAAELGPESARTFAHALDQLWEGQLMEPELASATSVEPHLEYIGLKTAALMEAAGAMGALSQGASAEQTAHLARFGHAVGMAFQIADDLLDHIGDPVVLGKAVGADLPRGVISVGAWHALSLHGLTPHTTDAAVVEALAAQDASVTYAMTIIGNYLASARTALHAATPESDVWDDARAMIASMLEHGVLQRHRRLIEQAVTSWPA